jgi:hypothetical protein
MNYLTNYYRNLCEQLQEKLNILEAQLNERYMGGNDMLSNRNWTQDALSRKLDPTETIKKIKIPTKDDYTKPSFLGISINDTSITDPRFHKIKKTGPDLYVRPKAGGNKFGDNRIPNDDIPYRHRLIDGSKQMRDREAERAAQTSGETDDDIYAMRQTAADQGGIPQDMVDAPINRTKQMPDGTRIQSQTPARVRVQPNIDAGPMKPKILPFRPQGLGDNALKAFDSVKTIPGVQAGEMTWGIVPKYGDAGMINSIEKARKVFK